MTRENSYGAKEQVQTFGDVYSRLMQGFEAFRGLDGDSWHIVPVSRVVDDQSSYWCPQEGVLSWMQNTPAPAW